MVDSRKLAANILSGVAANIVRVLLQLVMLPLMARLLGPSELGLYALAMPMINFVLLLSDAGLGDSLAKERTDDTVVWSSAFWGLVGTGLLSALVVYGASFVIAAISHQPRLPHIMLPLCLTLLMVATTVVPAARMMRRGNMVLGSMGDTVGNIVGAAIGATMAFAGFGVWAMVAQFITLYAVRTIVYNVVEPFVPKLQFNLRSLFAHTGMGGQILGGRLIELATSMFERSQVSRGLGASAVGGYANANQIGFFTSNAIGSPLWANLYYVAITQPREAVMQHYLRSHRTFALITFPAAALLAFAVPTVVPLFFGAAWRSNVMPVIVLVLACPLGNLGVLHSAILFARNQGRIVLITQTINAAYRMISVVLVYRYGVLALCGALAVSNVGYYLASVFVLSPIVGNRRRDLLRAIAPPFAASAVMSVAMYAVLPAAPTLLELIICGCGAFALYAVLLLVVDARQTREEIAALVQMITKRTASA